MAQAKLQKRSIARAVRDSHGDPLAPKQPTKSTIGQDISATKRQRHEPIAQIIRKKKNIAQCAHPATPVARITNMHAPTEGHQNTKHPTNSYLTKIYLNEKKA